MEDKIIDLLESAIKQLVEDRRPEKNIRDQVDIGYNYEKNTLELFEIRPRWNKKDEQIKLPYAKAKFIKSKAIWKIYWMRASGKWEVYEPNSEVSDLTKFFEIVDEDKKGCFRG
jgi:hypothetical protein